jgi:hypothetical protein
MKRECKTIAEITAAVQGDTRRRSMRLTYGGKAYLFRNNQQIRGADLLLKILIEGSKEMEKLLTGTK